MENIYAKHLAGIREEMREEGIDIYLIPHSDEHNSEYVGDADHDIAFACGFTGENTTVVITKDESRVWADGRYFLQAEHEIEGSGTDLMKMGVDGVPTVNEYLKSVAFDGAVFAYNGRKVTLSLAREYEKALKGKGVTIRPDFDLVSRLWADRPAKSCQPVWVL
ncbi:MAG: aminopeptidase P family N-terminal domain-containing protein, partial [Lachnospiraceae bacterium]|nr:aminopeptidase P family N-terminal domain-containing protein [Lachnospiraceae bacterium]